MDILMSRGGTVSVHSNSSDKRESYCLNLGSFAYASPSGNSGEGPDAASRWAGGRGQDKTWT